MSQFYSHIIEFESILVELDEMHLTDEQKKHLSSLIDSTIHQTVLDLVLSKLTNEDKILFINKLKDKKENQEIMEFLNLKIDNVEDEIKKAIEEIKKELHDDLKETKKIK